MNGLERRLDRLEQGGGSDQLDLWCCATKTDANALITRLRAEGSPPLLVFIAGEPNSDGSPCWRIANRTARNLWCAIDSMSSGSPRSNAHIDRPPPDPRFERMTDEQLLGAIAESGSTIVFYPDNSCHLLESGMVL